MDVKEYDQVKKLLKPEGDTAIAHGLDKFSEETAKGMQKKACVQTLTDKAMPDADAGTIFEMVESIFVFSEALTTCVVLGVRASV